MSQATFRDFIPEDADVAEHVEDVCLQLEQGGWYPRRRQGQHGIAYWPDRGRGRQIVIQINSPLNRYRVQNICDHTGLTITLTVRKGDEDGENSRV